MRIKNIDNFKTWKEFVVACKDARETSKEFKETYKLWNYASISVPIFFYGALNGELNLDRVNLKNGKVYCIIHNINETTCEELNLKEYFKQRDSKDSGSHIKDVSSSSSDGLVGGAE